MMTVIRVTNENGKKLHEETFTSEIRGTISTTVDTQLAALREAGEKMAEAIKAVTNAISSHQAYDKDMRPELRAALAEWEAANK